MSQNLSAWITYICIGIASLNIFNNYNAAYTYTPGDGGAASRMSSLSTPGDGGAASRMSSLGTPGGRGGGTEICCSETPGGFESSCRYIFWFNIRYLLVAVIGALLGGFYLRPNVQSPRDTITFYNVLMAFVCSRALLYVAVFITDNWFS